MSNIQNIRQEFSSQYSEIAEVLDGACTWETGACAKMRENFTKDSCCAPYGCPHLGARGCGLGDGRPVLCKLYLCDQAKRWLRIYRFDVLVKYEKLVRELHEKYATQILEEFRGVTGYVREDDWGHWGRGE
jgi:hypothetical protein